MPDEQDELKTTDTSTETESTSDPTQALTDSETTTTESSDGPYQGRRSSGGYVPT